MKYLFILSPPYQGSTVLYKLIGTSPNVSTLISPKNPSHVGEGCALFHMTNYRIQNYLKMRFNPEFHLDMNHVRRAYESIWDSDKTIMCDKSPPTIVRAHDYENYFKSYGDTYFICLIRDPFCCRYDMETWMMYASHIKHNMETLGNVILVKYEDLTNNINGTIQNLLDFLPELDNLDKNVDQVNGITSGDCVNGSRNSKIRNCNVIRDKEHKLKQLNDKHIDLMKYFGFVVPK